MNGGLHSITREFAVFYAVGTPCKGRGTQSALRYRIAPFSELFSLPTSLLLAPTNACTSLGQLLFSPEVLTRHIACSARLYLKLCPSSAFTS
jgi:hypothetical protein